jgi:hypothetical protein
MIIMETKTNKPNKLRNLAYATLAAAAIGGLSHGLSTDTVESKNLVYKDFVSYGGGTGQMPELVFYNSETNENVSIPYTVKRPEEMEKGKTYVINSKVPKAKIFGKRFKSIEDIK